MTVLNVSPCRLHRQLVAAVELADDADAVLTLVDRAIAAGHSDIAAELSNLSWRMRSTAYRWIWFVEDSLKEDPATESCGLNDGRNA